MTIYLLQMEIFDRNQEVRRTKYLKGFRAQEEAISFMYSVFCQAGFDKEDVKALRTSNKRHLSMGEMVITLPLLGEWSAKKYSGSVKLWGEYVPQLYIEIKAALLSLSDDDFVGQLFTSPSPIEIPDYFEKTS